MAHRQSQRSLGFIKTNEGNKRLPRPTRGPRSDPRHVSNHHRCRAEFITTVTINNNRQNPVEPWSLHANDMIQLELQDKFRDELGIFYQRQERAFENLTDEDLEDQGIREYKAIELPRLARLFL